MSYCPKPQMALNDSGPWERFEMSRYENRCSVYNILESAARFNRGKEARM